ncbi:MAG TPA: dockerin type I repeat-containing protein [Rhodothermia bacterium]|nr:dockerin type I repeat-containing protein [Rhodothermia bacterium]
MRGFKVLRHVSRRLSPSQMVLGVAAVSVALVVLIIAMQTQRSAIPLASAQVGQTGCPFDAVSCESRGDINCDGEINSDDIDLLITVLFCEPCTECPNQDVNGDGLISAADVLVLINFVTEGTPTPTATTTPTGPTPTQTTTPTTTPTPGANDCCQCPGGDNLCEDVADGQCPQNCNVVFSAACEDPQVGCVTFTPTPTNTPGPNDCCQCSGGANLCENVADGQCPENCDIVFSAACEDPQVGCVTFTPTPTPSTTTTPTPTPPPGSQDCCQCTGNVCEQVVDGTCPENCQVVFGAVCLVPEEGCVVFTPTPTSTPVTPSRTPTFTPTPKPTFPATPTQRIVGIPIIC